MASPAPEHLKLPFKTDILPAWATSVHQDLIGRYDRTPQIQCTKVLPPKYGSYNIVFPLQFSDGVFWALKVPHFIPHEQFDASAAQALISEARTLQLLKRETTIPIPTVHYFNADQSNALKYPFILMDFIHGIPLSKVWFDRSISPDLLNKRRLQTLHDLAEAMIQLGTLTFSQGGSPQFDHQGNICGIESLRRTDIAASLSTPDDSGTDIDVTCDDGNTSGILDWEGVGALPSCSGNMCYPTFLTRDWDPLFYAYEPDGNDEDNKSENSPEELKSLRQTYYHHITQKLLMTDPTLCNASETDPAKWTRRSMVIENVRIAADNPLCTHGIISTIFEKIKEQQQQPHNIMDSLYLYDIACDLVDGTLEEGVLGVLKDGLLGLCEDA
ncbi:hypothetical protein BO78DRAFT_448715 [Aspergillus sclerotiicarbonarius CBS 121057]|uniref:Aminoglycoside phosphotransferase domain-containing protein n=1 Tax=Aspergillus sclerotiicarbonarius (strain CBS 121057 / IBT 28362) TaxID=1448318 RepID=A0A319ELA1_ASPSB|nr:hypothetical protein BO78DRAFT_448715 [Aspergillus sclerotiicarbonarius CBS 121057]